MTGLFRQTLISVLLLPLWSPLVSAQWFVDATAESFYNDNLPRAQYAAQAHEDLGLNIGALAGYHFQPWTYTGLTLSGTLTNTSFERYDGMNNVDAGLTLGLSHKFGLGPNIPILALDLSAERDKFDVDIRDVWNYGISLSLRKRLSDTFNLSATMRHEERDGDWDPPVVLPATQPGQTLPLYLTLPHDVWTYDVLSFTLQGELDLNEVAWLSGSYQIQDGDVVSSGFTNQQILDASTAIANDALFGSGTIAYRIPALTQGLSLDLNRAVLSAGTVYLGMDYQYTRGRGGINYPVRNVRAGFIYSF